MTFATTDIICNIEARNNGILKTVISNQLCVNNVPQSLYFTLNMFGLSTGNKQEQCDKIQSGEQTNLAGFDVPNKHFDLLINLYNNIGFSVVVFTLNMNNS